MIIVVIKWQDVKKEKMYEKHQGLQNNLTKFQMQKDGRW
jgi:hypothetical protein